MTEPLSSGEKLLEINGVELCVETYGRPANPAVLLIGGATASMLWWEAELCQRIAACERFVIRYDHRDTGRSTSYPPGQPGYTITDLTADALGILSAFGVERGHLVCQSMFGGIGLIAGVDHPDRVASLTFVSTTTGEATLPPPVAELAADTPAAPDPADPAAVVNFIVASVEACSGGSPHFDEVATRALAERHVARARNIASTLANHYAIEFDGPARGGFGDITAPTLVVHGDRDPLLPLPHGEALRDAIPGSKLLILAGAGHDLPGPLWDEFVPALVRHTAPDRPSPRAGDLFDYDAELRRHNELFRAATGVRPHDRVLDIGCGAGQSTREAARAAVAGSALGVDTSARMLDHARRLSDEEGLRNVAYLQADAQIHRFPPAHFDLCVSRFGTMFFADLVATFTNIARALRPAARLVLLVWQSRERNEWSTEFHRALAGTAAPPVPVPGQDPFSLADPSTTEAILAAAGFGEIHFTDVHEPVYYGPDSAAAYDTVLRLREPQDLLSTMDTEAADHARRRLRATLAAHGTDDGVYFDSRAWLITARHQGALPDSQ
ncbi:alpha/beta fold hydrolase [Amycolatopsis nigrescens]|uniref:alpha/beta fold hydrolase n=1 Tax=Amycolatopsis nigrescens TaxID=381445 RepID=UPI00037BD23F|nr:alpha/beta fold hydrolase [Amycolatopsis nigrescens]